LLALAEFIRRRIAIWKMSEFSPTKMKRNQIIYAMKSGFMTMMVPKRIERREKRGIVERLVRI
jgi:hypothetical protein